MLDAPPSSSVSSPPRDWGAFVGGGKVDLPQDDSLRSKVDKPPEDHKHDALQIETAADMAANRGLREQFAGKAYRMATGCLIAWFLMLLTNGVVNIVLGRTMWSDNLLIAVTSGVTVSVLAAFLGVIRGLFPGTSPKEKTGQSKDAAGHR